MSDGSNAVLLSSAALERACAAAVRGVGGSEETAAALAAASVQAEQRGKPAVGAAHLLDYLDALRSGRLNGAPAPTMVHSRAAAISVEADAGAAQVVFDRARPALIDSAERCGVAVLSIRNSFSAGELAHYTTQVADHGLIALACANSPALMAAYGARTAVTGTNPLSFALPHSHGPRVFDQAASETAWVSVRDAAARGESIPEGWALGPDGEPTTDAAAGIDGALLPFGGVKGANIAMMVEMLATLAGGSFSLDAGPFDSGVQPPQLGLFVAAIDPAAFDPGFAERAEAHHRRLTEQHGVDFGRRKSSPAEIAIPHDVHEALLAAARPPERSKQ
ncbi:Ldh family oxidoreductase [Ruania alba]|uniref:(2R)-3-sulfolactate dehydrogenase (NADP+) n=1 Tax=Ruania alba TaxID=648782 RepID=A0A1H5N075_9MICO|nr:Ldh family oxidoreductase [Ruania alba]SEE94953.1 (2R)-3-sulfolactate dehydrogenase (NADP+) [Ruania alba]